MKKWGKQSPIYFDLAEMNTNLGTGNYIFVGSSCDMFAENVDEGHIHTILKKCRDSNNEYLFQSKNTERMLAFQKYFPVKSILCTTIETNRFYPPIMVSSPTPEQRAISFNRLEGFYKYITIEPIIDFDIKNLTSMIRMINPLQVNIGADSGGNGLPEPSSEKIITLIDELNTFTKVHKKKNLDRLLRSK